MGAATAGHQVEGDNVNADTWLLENIRPTIYGERSGDALNSFELWPQDLDLACQIGLNSHRFSLEWARIEPDPGRFSIAMLDHYKRMIEGCRAEPDACRHLQPLHHPTLVRRARRLDEPRGAGPVRPLLRSRRPSPGPGHRLCHHAKRAQPAAHLPADPPLRPAGTPPADAGRGGPGHRCGQVRRPAHAVNLEDLEVFTENFDTRAQGRTRRDQGRSRGPACRRQPGDDRRPGRSRRRGSPRRRPRRSLWRLAGGGARRRLRRRPELRARGLGRRRQMPVPTGAPPNGFMGEVYPSSLAGAVRYAHQVAGVPVLVTEHGIVTKDDTIRARFIPAALRELRQAIADGVPVKGWCPLVAGRCHSSGRQAAGPNFGSGLGGRSRDLQAHCQTWAPRCCGAITRRNAI
ncbi:family 1 glycosylhydrolase [Caulobacter segnis]